MMLLIFTLRKMYTEVCAIARNGGGKMGTTLRPEREKENGMGEDEEQRV